MIAAIIQARMGSTRLPGKVMMDLSGKPVLWHVVDRVSKATRVDYVIVATTIEKEDDKIKTFCNDNNIAVFRGSSEDVLKRYADTARMLKEKIFDLTLIVRITSDCPLIDPEIIDKIIIKMKNGDYDYVSNTLEPTYPDGLDVEVFTLSALLDADLNASLPSEREHVTSYLKTNPRFRQLNVMNDVNLSSMRWTLDQQEDYYFINNVYKSLYNPKKPFKIYDILELLRRRPELILFNNTIGRDEGYKKSLQEDAEYLMRIQNV
jgi:spore coat polysaccharide biosynthesis protein SpsF (cytidylyltransferase family)